MPRASYIGIDNVARSVKKMYVGVSDQARKLKKAYIGINDVAKLFWSGGSLSALGRYLQRDEVTGGFTVATTEHRAIIAGGNKSNQGSSNIQSIDADLTCHLADTLNTGRFHAGGCSLGNIVIFAGGCKSHAVYYAFTDTVEGYDTEDDTLIGYYDPTGFSYPCRHISAAKAGSYAVFAGGDPYVTTSSGTPFNLADASAYDESGCRHSVDKLQTARYNIGTAVAGNFTLFAGGTLSTNSTYRSRTEVDAYAANDLTRTSETPLATSRMNMGAGSVGNYALFAGGTNQYTSSDGSILSSVEAYDADLTQFSAASLSTSTEGIACGNFEDMIVFVNNDIFDVYDSNLTQSSLDLKLSTTYKDPKAMTIGHFLLVAGAQENIDVFEK